MGTVAATQTSTTTWNIDPAHAVAEFKVKHMMISHVKGHFGKISGKLTLDETDLANSHIEAVIDANALETRDSQRDAHLKSADFFDVEQFSDARVQLDARQGCRRRRTVGRGRPDDPRSDSQSDFRGGRANPANQGSLGQYASWDFGHHQDQPQGLWADLERGA